MKRVALPMIFAALAVSCGDPMLPADFSGPPAAAVKGNVVTGTGAPEAARPRISLEWLDDLNLSLVGQSLSYQRSEKLQTDWDIGLAPLRDLEFHRGKNNARYREYASAGIAGIYSDAAIHRASIVHRHTGLLVPHESERAWHDAIRELADDVALRRTIQRNAFADVAANYRMDRYVETKPQARALLPRGTRGRSGGGVPLAQYLRPQSFRPSAPPLPYAAFSE